MQDQRQGYNRKKLRGGGKVTFPDVILAFSCKNFHIGRPHKSFSGFLKVKEVLSFFFISSVLFPLHFSCSSFPFPFSSFYCTFSILLPFFPYLVFFHLVAKIPRWKVSGEGHTVPPSPLVTPLSKSILTFSP